MSEALTQRTTLPEHVFGKRAWHMVRKPLISLFIIVHLTFIYCTFFPEHKWTQAVVDQTKGYMTFLGLGQTYAVFAPAPREVNVHVGAVVTYLDGTSRRWDYPRMDRLSQVERIPKERYRKFGCDNLAWSNVRHMKMLPDMARYIARLNYDDPKNPPKLVSIYRYTAPIPKPKDGLGKPLPPQSIYTDLIQYKVNPAEDLK